MAAKPMVNAAVGNKIVDAVSFKHPWRAYQARVLRVVERHLDNQRLHLVAAPGAGKTTLGLEVFRRLGRPCLILSPTRTIRDQWLLRLRDFFPDDVSAQVPWVSRHLDEPAFLTSITYQALHTDYREDIAEEDEDAEDTVRSLLTEPLFVEPVLNHPWMTEETTDIAVMLDDVQLLVGLLAFRKRQNKPLPKHCLKALDTAPIYLPDMDHTRRGGLKKDYHAVPTVLGINKDRATVFHRHWNRRVAKGNLISTRNPQGGAFLLKARARAFSSRFLRETRRLSQWQ